MGDINKIVWRAIIIVSLTYILPESDTAHVWGGDIEVKLGLVLALLRLDFQRSTSLGGVVLAVDWVAFHSHGELVIAEAPVSSNIAMIDLNLGSSLLGGRSRGSFPLSLVGSAHFHGLDPLRLGSKRYLRLLSLAEP